MDAAAEKIFWQAAELDPRNAIAIVGLARVASDRGDDRTALQFAHKALEIDPENPAAIRLSARLEEIIRYREEAELDGARATPEPPAEAGPVAVAGEPEPVSTGPEPEPTSAPVATGPAPAREEGTVSEPALPPLPVLPPQVTLPPMPAAPAGARPAPPVAPKRGLFRRLMGGR
jgi:hypothetical protein